jgi:uncharacterized protein DUF4154
MKLQAMGRDHGTWRSTVAATVVGLAVLLTLSSSANANDIPPDLEIAIHLKILSFDDGLKERATGNAIVIAILYPPKNESAASDYVAAVTELSEKQKVSVHGKKVRAVAIPIVSDLADRLSGINALYITNAATGDQVSAITKIAFANKLPTLSGTRGFLGYGVAVAVVAKDNKPAIVIHAANASHSGMVLDSKLLRLAEVVK